jgi:hypothetical protein
MSYSLIQQKQIMVVRFRTNQCLFEEKTIYDMGKHKLKPAKVLSHLGGTPTDCIACGRSKNT